MIRRAQPWSPRSQAGGSEDRARDVALAGVPHDVLRPAWPGQHAAADPGQHHDQLPPIGHFPPLPLRVTRKLRTIIGRRASANQVPREAGRLLIPRSDGAGGRQVRAEPSWDRERLVDQIVVSGEQCLKPVDVDDREGRTFPVIE